MLKFPMTKIDKMIFATFSCRENGQRTATNGMIEPMTYYFTPRVNKFVLIDQPYPGSDTVIPFIEHYKKGKLSKTSRSSLLVKWLYPFLMAQNKMGTRISFKLRDFLSVLDYASDKNEKYDLFVGLESVNALAGAVLKKFGKVKKVVYYVSDYSPERYKSGWFNALYLILDRLAVKTADHVWDVSKAMMPARIKAGLNPKYADKLIHVPNALFPKQINYLPAGKVNLYDLAYAGTIGKENGPDVAINALGSVKKEFKKIKLHIFGGGEKDLDRLTKLTKKLKLEENVIFHGFISDQVLLSNEIKKCSIGLAPYREIPGDPRWWADATKIRLYLAAGLPVITTKVPPLGKEVEEAGAGIIAKDSAQDLAKNIIKLLKDKKLFAKTKQRAIDKGKSNTWKNTYEDATKRIR